MKKRLLFTALLISSSLFASTTYVIDANIEKGGKFIDSPSLIAPIKQAGVASNKIDKHSYELLAEVAEQKGDVVIVYTNLTVDEKFHKQKFKLLLNQAGTVQMGDTKLTLTVSQYKKP
jgi:hypothetical protein